MASSYLHIPEPPPSAQEVRLVQCVNEGCAYAAEGPPLTDFDCVKRSLLMKA